MENQWHDSPNDLTGKEDAFTGQPLNPTRALYKCECGVYYHDSSYEAIKRDRNGQCNVCSSTLIRAVSSGTSRHTYTPPPYTHSSQARNSAVEDFLGTIADYISSIFRLAAFALGLANRHRIAAIMFALVALVGIFLINHLQLNRQPKQVASQSPVSGTTQENPTPVKSVPSELSLAAQRQAEAVRERAFQAQQALQREAEEAQRQLAAATKDNPFVNSLGMKFVPVPGTHVLFCIWEMREQDYQAYAMENSGVDNSWQNSWQNLGFGQGFKQVDNDPVAYVSWEDAEKFCAWLSKKESKKYRLPTDEEWSVAVGLNEPNGGTPAEKDGKIENVYPWGRGPWIPIEAEKDFNLILDIRKHHEIMPVGSYSSNQYGIYDLCGNVWEWCEDWYDGYKLSRVIRGACWRTNMPRNMLLSRREYRSPDNRAEDIGFRCVLELNSAPN